MIALARLHLARVLLVLGAACIRLAPWAAWPHPARALLWLSDVCARASRQVLQPMRAAAL